MTSAARIAANRRNALRSSGPRSTAGKARSAQNSRRHGLTAAVADPDWSQEVSDFAQAIAGSAPGPQRWELACRIAAAQVDVARARTARCLLYPELFRDAGGVPRLAALDRYERRAFSRRRAGLSEFEELR
ncbi:MAG TPA: hypothetical protein VGF60_17200 [Xanthobacteraceae bacterium]|jgi:hypothetical protein